MVLILLEHIFLKAVPAIHSVFIIKYDVNGNVLWAHQSVVPSSTSGADLEADWVTTDKEGNAYITGYFFVDTVSFGSYKLSCSRQAMFLVKYDPNGNVLWAEQSNTGGTGFFTATTGFGVTTDHSGNVYIDGTFNEQASFDTIIVKGYYGSFVAKYDSSGNLLWANAPTKTPNVSAISISADKYENIYVAGNFSDTLVAGKTTLIGQYLNVTYAYIIKYDSNGNAIWAQRSSTPSANSNDNARVNDITTDTYNGVYLIGSLNDTISFGNFTLISPASTGASNMYLAKFDSSGKVLWAKSSLGDPNSSQWQGYSVVADTLGNIFLTAGDRRIGFDSIYFDSVTYQVTNTNDGNSLILEMDTSGKVLCGAIVSGGGDDKNGVSASPGGNYVNFGGDLETNVIFGPDTLSYNVYVEVPFMTQWNPCYSSAIKLANRVNYNCTTGTATAVITISGAQVSSVKWNTIPTQNGDTATGLTVGTYIASVILLDVPDTVNDTIMVKSTGFKDSITIIPSSTIICNGQSDSLKASGGTYYTWVPVTGLNATTGESVIAAPTVTTTYTVTGTNSNGCSATNTVTVTVNPTPTITASPSPASYCPGGSSTLSASGGNIYTWTPATGLSATTGSSITANPAVTTTYTVTGTNSNGCSASNIVMVTVNSNPIITASPSPPSYCPGGSSVLTASGGDTYTWSPSTGLSDTIGSSVTANPTITTTYTVTGTDSSGCSGVNTIIVTVVSNPTITVSPNPVSYCPGGSSVLSASGGSTYTWSPSIGLSATTGDSVTANPTVTTIYTITGNTGSCTSTTTVTVNVDSVSPLIILPQPPPFICFTFQSDTLRVASQGTDFTWSPSEGLSATTGVSVIANPSVSITYTVTGIDSLGCPATGTEPVTILPIVNKPSFIQHNDTLISSAKTDNQWYRNDTLLTNDTSQYLIISILGNYYVEINNEANGCSTSSDTVDITSLTGVNQLTVESGQVTVYPNPFTDQIFIKINSSVQDVKDWAMQLTDVLGRTLYSMPSLNYTNEIDLSDLPNGMYFIAVITKTGRAVVPVVKQ